MPVIIVDASVILEVLVQSGIGLRLEGRLFDSGATLHAPHLLDIEVAQVLRRLLANQKIDPVRAGVSFRSLGELPLRRYPHTLLLARVWQLRHDLTAYDAAYVALAEALGAPLVTRHRRIANSSAHQARVELV
jgi:predicted nucleic acid-binding protein